jgi:hypothetical protein
LETLANELLTNPKRRQIKQGRERTLNTANFEVIRRATHYLRKLENLEYKYSPQKDSILLEVKRITNRQFNWQRGYLNIPQFYRNAYVYGQGACSTYFEATNGITVSQFSLIGFGIYSFLVSRPALSRTTNMTGINVQREELDAALQLISLPISDARALASRNRANIFHTAYRPSIFRTKPCLRFDDRISAPLPQLVLERVTSGIFYDVVGGGGPVRHDYGRRFERYCLAYVRSMLPNFQWHPESRYEIKRKGYDTPDILCQSGETLICAVECKASRMSYEGRFGNDLLADRGYEELTKAVFQLWRFFSHCRRGLIKYSISEDILGVVLTLEDWLTMANPLREAVISAAEKMAAARDPNILSIDRRPVTFIAIDDLEHTLASASHASFIRTIRAAATDQYVGWHLDGVHKYFRDADQPLREYPFTSKMGHALPWWNLFDTEDGPNTHRQISKVI